MCVFRNVPTAGQRDIKNNNIQIKMVWDARVDSASRRTVAAVSGRVRILISFCISLYTHTRTRHHYNLALIYVPTIYEPRWRAVRCKQFGWLGVLHVRQRFFYFSSHPHNYTLWRRCVLSCRLRRYTDYLVRFDVTHTNTERDDATPFVIPVSS